MAGKRKSNNFIWIKSVIALFVICSIGKIMTQLDIYLIAASVVILIFSLAIYYHQKNEHEREDFIRSNKKIIDFNNFQHTPLNLKNFNALKLEQLRKMNPFVFEEYIASMFRVLGYKDAKATKRTDDGGKDVIMHDAEGQLYYVECKRFGKNSTVGRPIIQKIVGACYPDGARGIVINSNKFSQKAIAEAKKSGVRLIGPVELLEMIEKAEAIQNQQEALI